jgi:amino acid adenylation domain-containing protein
VPSVLELPTDRPRPPVQVFRGGLHQFALPASLVEPLRAIGEVEQVTLFMILLTAFKILLHRYSHEEDIVVGTPIANRTRAEVEGLIGFFANTLVLRTRLSGGLSFRQLLGRVREVTLGAYAHQDMPFEKLVEELSPKRNLAYNPLFQVMFVLQNMGKVAGGARQQQQPDGGMIDTGAAKFDMTLFLTETTQGVQACFEYNSDLFDQETVARMAKHFETLLSAAVADPDQPVWSLPMLSQSELLTLSSWNDTEAPLDARCVHTMFEEQATRTPDAAAVSSGGRTLSYRELNDRANFWAHRLLESGILRDDCVGICMERSVEMIVAVLAALKAGAAYVPLDPNYPRERLAYMIDNARVSMLLTQARFGSALPTGDARVLTLDGEGDGGTRADNPRGGAGADNLAYVIYTSGSTGRPKGVAMPHRPLVNLLGWQIARSSLPEGARTLQFASLSFDVSFQEIFSTLCAGGTLILIAEEQKRDPEAVWQLLRTAEVNRLYLPFVALQQLAERAREIVKLPSSLREIITAGEQPYITPQLVQLFTRLDCAFYNQYGPSESHVVTELKLSGPPAAWASRPPVGRPIPNLTIRLADDYGELVPVGVPGELFIGGVGLARGYINRPELTAERFVADPEGDQRAGRRLYRTGDRARYLPDGNIEFLGRLDDQLKIHGFRIEPGEIELTLSRHASVREAAVVARAGGAGEQRLIAYVQLNPAASATAHELRAHLAVALPEHMLPSAFAFLDAMPLTPSGKLDRRALPEPKDLVTAGGAEFVAPRTPVEESLAQIWGELLGLEQVGVHDNFFELGGHSLLATRVVSWIRDGLCVDLPVRRLFETPTIEGLALSVVQASVGREDEDEAARLLAELEQLSDEEAQALLRGESIEIR